MTRTRSSFHLSSTVALAATCVILAGAAPPGGGSTPPSNPAIAYTDSGIKVMNADGTNIRTLVSLRRGENARSPAWSPNSSEIVYWGTIGSVTGLYAVPVAGGASRRVATTMETSFSATPDWSPVATPDGRYRIAFSDQGTLGGSDIYVVSPDGTGRLNLTSTPDQAEAYPTWSPDGQRLAVQRGYAEVVIFDLDVVNGSLAIVGETVVFSGGPGWITPHVRWAKTSDLLTYNETVMAGVYSRIVTLDLSDPTAAPDFVTPSYTYDERWPSFSPDDTRLAFQRLGTGGGIFVINANGTGQVRINSRGTDPNWRRTP